MSSTTSPEFSTPAFLLWLSLAILADILSLIPYVGLLFSWPFAALFMFYKFRKKLGKSKILITTLMDFIGEGLFSTLPMNTLDVIFTYTMAKASNIPLAGELLQKVPTRNLKPHLTPR